MDRRTLLLGIGASLMLRDWFRSPFTDRAASLADALNTWDGGHVRLLVGEAKRLLNQEHGNPASLAQLAGLVGYIDFDAGRTTQAERHLVQAHRQAERVKGYHGASLKHRARVSMVRHLVHNQHAIKALGYAPEDRDWRTATERALGFRARARAWSNVGDRYETLKAIGKADDHWSRHDVATDPPWLAVCGGDPEHWGDTGQSLGDLALRGHPVLAERAVDLLTKATYARDAHLRTQVFSGVTAATVAWEYLDREQALDLADDALDALCESPFESSQARVMLMGLRRRVKDVDELLTARIDTALTIVC